MKKIIIILITFLFAIFIVGGILIGVNYYKYDTITNNEDLENSNEEVVSNEPTLSCFDLIDKQLVADGFTYLKDAKWGRGEKNFFLIDIVAQEFQIADTLNMIFLKEDWYSVSFESDVRDVYIHADKQVWDNYSLMNGRDKVNAYEPNSAAAYYYNAFGTGEYYRELPIWMDYYIEQNFDTMSAIEGADLADVVNADKIMTKKVLSNIDGFSKKKHLVMAHYSSSHYPFYFPEDKAIFKPYLDEPFSKKNYLFLEKIKPKLINSFYNSVAFTDDEFGKILDKLISTGHMKDTIVIVTSDHGCEFGEDGHFFYSSTLKRYQTQVPLAMYIPSMKNGVRYTAPSSHLDLFPTIFDAMDYTGDMVNFQGHSLLKESTSDDYAIVTYQEVFEPKKFSIIDQSYKLVVDYDQAAFVTDMTDFEDNPVKDITDKKKRIKYLFDSIHYFRGRN